MLKTDHILYQEDLSNVSEVLQKCGRPDRKIKILVTGATGLIGSFLTDALLYYNTQIQRKFEIYAMGRSMERLKKRFSYAGPSEIYLWKHDIMLPMEKGIYFDYIFHLASNADPGQYASYPFETITTNVLGSIHMIQYAKEHPSSRILFASSMEVYGENDGTALQESDYGIIDYNAIRSGYPESKRVSELLYRSAVHEYGISCCIARLGYIYGPTMTDSDNKVVAQFLKSAVNGYPLILKSLGKQRRTYCYVTDAVTGMLLIMLLGENGEAYNIADKNSLVTIRQLGEMIAKQAGVELQIRNGPDVEKRSVDKNDVILNAEKLEMLGWSARIGVDEGIRRTIGILTKEIDELSRKV